MLQISTRLIMEAALARGWKAMPLDDRFVSTLAITPPNLRTYYFDSCQPPLTSAAAMVIADNKLSTYLIAQSQGIPVADFLMVEPKNLQPARDFLHTQTAVGHQLVVKPIDTNHGDGITVGVTTEDALADALEFAQKFSQRILLQRRHYGDDCRLLVVNGKVIAASQRVPAHVIGDGTHTIRQLVDLRNGQEAHDLKHGDYVDQINMNNVERFLGEEISRVPKADEYVTVSGTANLGHGGKPYDITADIHPSFKKAAELIAQTLDMFVCGADFIAQDYTKPLMADNAVLLEINATPGLRMHHYPAKGKGHDAAGIILDEFYRKITSTNN